MSSSDSLLARLTLSIALATTVLLPAESQNRAPAHSHRSHQCHPWTGIDRIGPLGAWEHWWIHRGHDLLLSRLGGVASGAPTGIEPSVRTRVVEALESATTEAFFDCRRAGLIGLGKVGNPGHVPLLVRGLADEMFMVRQAAVLALGLMGDPQAIDDLVGILEASEPAKKRLNRRLIQGSTQSTAALALGAIGRRNPSRRGEIRAALIRAVDSPNTHRDTRCCAVLALGLLQDRASLDPLLRAVRESSVDLLRGQAALALGMLGDRSAVESLHPLLEAPSPFVRQAALHTIGRLAKPEDEISTTLLIRLLRSDSDLECRGLALLALGRIGGARAETFLLGGLRSTEGADAPDLVVFSALGLASGPAPDRLRHREVILEALRDASDPRMRAGLAVAVEMISPRTAGNETAEGRTLRELLRTPRSISDPLDIYASIETSMALRSNQALEGLVALYEDTESGNELLRAKALFAMGNVLDPADPPLMSLVHQAVNFRSTARVLGDLFRNDPR